MLHRAVFVLVAGLVVAACSSSPKAVAPVDAGPTPSQSLGGPCDPSVPASCAQPTDACSVAECDPQAKVCVRVAVDGGPSCGGVAPPAPDAGDASDDAAVAADAAPDATGAASDASDASDAASDASDASDAAIDAGDGDAASDAGDDAGDAGAD